MVKRTQRVTTLVMLISVLGALLAACGGSDASNSGAAGGAQPSTAGGGAGASAAASTAAGGTGASAAASMAAGGASAAASTAAGGASAAAGGGMALPAECSSVELAYWNPFSGPDGPFMNTLVEQFQTANPQVTVNVTTINNNDPPGAYYNRIGTAKASNQLPDVVIVHADQLATQAFRNTIRPIDELVSQIGIQESDFPEAVWGPGQVAGKRYSVPLDIHPMTMFYNEDLLKAAGVNSPPTNGEQFAQAAQAMTQGENKGFMLTTGFPVQQIFQQMLHQYGGSEFNEDGTKATWNSEAGVQALQWMKDVQSKYGEVNLETDAELNSFRSGTLGMAWNGIWQTTSLTGDQVEFAGRATAVPQIGPNPGTWAGSHQLALARQETEDPCRTAAGGMLIKYLVDNSVEWAKAGQIPASNTVRESEAFKAVEPQASIAPSVEGAFFPPAVPGITDAFAPLGEAVGAVMAGTETDIKAALDNAATRADQILEQNKANFGEEPTQ